MNRKLWIKLAAFMLAAILIFILGTALSIVSYSEKDETRHADAAVVLGASVYDNSPSPVFCERINHAVELYKDGYVKAVIMTGGVGEGNIRSESYERRVLLHRIQTDSIV